MTIIEDGMSTTQELPPIAIDFETYYSKTYSLTKLPILHYVMDQQFEVIGFSYAEIGKAPMWYSGSRAAVARKLNDLQLHRRTVIAHNAMFEGAILEWQFGITPLCYMCTMMGARPFITPYTGSTTLAKCAEFLNLPEKGKEVLAAIGKRREDFTRDELRDYGVYCCRDNLLSMLIYQHVEPQLPDEEQTLIDLTIKKFVRPRFELDEERLYQASEDIATYEAKTVLILEALGVTRAQVVSNELFASLLKANGLEPPTKISPVTGERTWAFAKRDPEFLALRAHPNSTVSTLVEARIHLKSSIERTRVDSFLKIARLQKKLPIPLLYYGAHTGRFSGMMGINLQNLPRNSELRKSLRAPPGFKVVSADLKAIEARITAVLAGQHDVVRWFAEGRDVYSEFATDLYGYPVSDRPETADERFVGKMCILGLGFGMGATKFAHTMEGLGISMTTEMADRVVRTYRRRFPRIPQLWRRMDGFISNMLELRGSAWTSFAPDGVPVAEFKAGRMILPNKMPVFYPKMTRGGMNEVSFETFAGTTPTRAPLWGGTLTENLVQALARIIISRAEVRLAKAGLISVLQVHDELVFIVPEHTVNTVKEVLQRVLCDPVPWLPSLPIACSIGVGDSYGDAK